jgi:hypothetical protein
MHPDVCRFVSEVVYESRLHAIPECAQQRIDAKGSLTGTGVRFIEIDHAGNTRASTEEADAIAAAIAGLAGAIITESDGVERTLELADVMVVTPYNAQVRRLVDRLPEGVRIGTVDKFQGQEAHVVFFSMATSSAPRFPATSSSSTAATDSTSQSPAPAASRFWYAIPNCCTSTAAQSSRCDSSTRSAAWSSWPKAGMAELHGIKAPDVDRCRPQRRPPRTVAISLRAAQVPV